MVATNSKYDITPLHKINNLSVEYYCEVSATFIKNYNLIILCFYRSPAANFKLFMENLHKIFQHIDVSKNIVVCGDFNVKFNLRDRESLELEDFLATYNLISSVSFNTRGNNRIDNLFHNMDSSRASMGGISVFSDHNGILASFKTTSLNEDDLPKTKYIRRITNENTFSFYNDLQSTDWNFIKTITNGNEAFSAFFGKFLSAYETHFPLKIVPYTTNKKNVNWFTDELKIMRNNLEAFENVYTTNPNEVNKLK